MHPALAPTVSFKLSTNSLVCASHINLKPDQGFNLPGATYLPVPMETPQSGQTFVFVDSNPVSGRNKRTAQIVKSQARSFGHRERREREQQARRGVQKRLLKSGSSERQSMQIVNASAYDPATPEEEAAIRNGSFTQQSPITLLGAGRVDPFSILPLSPTLPIRKYLDHWITILAPSLCGLSPEDKNHASMQSVWMPRAYSDPTLLAATMFSSVAHLQMCQESPGPEYYVLKDQVLKLINRNLSNPESAISDTNIAAILCMARFGSLTGEQNHKGNAVQHQPHKDVLARIIALRGGLENLGFDGLLAKMIMLCDILNATLEATPSRFFPSTIPDLTYTTSLPPLRKFSMFSPLLSSPDELKSLSSLPTRGPEISAIVSEMYNLTLSFRDTDTSHPLPIIPSTDLSIQEKNASRDRCLALAIGASMHDLSAGSCKLEKCILAACWLAARIYRRALVFGIPFSDEVNYMPMRALRSMLERTGIDGAWGQMPGVLLWVLSVGGGAAAAKDAEVGEREFFIGQLVRLGMGVGMRWWDEFRTGVTNFIWVQLEMKDRRAMAVNLEEDVDRICGCQNRS